MKFTELTKQEYAGNNCKFSAGFVVGSNNPDDTMYLRIEKDRPDGTHDERTYLLRPDELAAIAFIASGAVWSDAYKLFDKLEKYREETAKTLSDTPDQR